jgi:RNA polymerase sigma-70 factor (ECF subfamily)
VRIKYQVYLVSRATRARNPMNNGSDHESQTRESLLLRVRDPGDQQAWAEFDRRYRPMIRGWCRHWFPRETEDKVQEVYCKLIDRLRTFEYDPSQGRFRGWLKTLTNRLMVDLKRSRDPAVPDGEAFMDQLEAGQDLYQRLAAEHDLELLETAKACVRGRVEEQTWTAYVETAERGRKPAAVARELNLRVGSVYQAKHRVITELRREIEIREG